MTFEKTIEGWTEGATQKHVKSGAGGTPLNLVFQGEAFQYSLTL